MPIPIILGAIAAAGAITSAVLTARANKKHRDALDKEANRQKQFYEGQLNENPLDQFHNRALIGEMRRAANARIEQERARRKITGELDATNIMKDQNAQAMQNMYSRIATNASLRRDGILNAYERSRQGIYAQQADLQRAAMQNYANLASNIGNAAATAMGGYSGKGIGIGGGSKAPKINIGTQNVDTPAYNSGDIQDINNPNKNTYIA